MVGFQFSEKATLSCGVHGELATDDDLNLLTQIRDFQGIGDIAQARGFAFADYNHQGRVPAIPFHPPSQNSHGNDLSIP